MTQRVQTSPRTNNIEQALIEQVAMKEKELVHSEILGPRLAAGTIEGEDESSQVI